MKNINLNYICILLLIMDPKKNILNKLRIISQIPLLLKELSMEDAHRNEVITLVFSMCLVLKVID